MDEDRQELELTTDVRKRSNLGGKRVTGTVAHVRTMSGWHLLFCPRRFFDGTLQLLLLQRLGVEVQCQSEGPTAVVLIILNAVMKLVF